MQPNQFTITNQRWEFANAASVSVGKPAMISAPNTAPGQTSDLINEAHYIVSGMTTFHAFKD